MAPEDSTLRLRLRLEAAPEAVFDLLATDAGRQRFWAERTEQRGDELTFHFPNGEVLHSRIAALRRPSLFALGYFGGSALSFELRAAGTGTDLLLLEAGVPAGSLRENHAGWVSVLLALKATADHGVDLRNHDPACTWNEGYVDN